MKTIKKYTLEQFEKKNILAKDIFLVELLLMMIQKRQL